MQPATGLFLPYLYKETTNTQNTMQGTENNNSSFLEATHEALLELLQIAEHQAGAEGGEALPADLLHSLRNCVKVAAHYKSIEGLVQGEYRALQNSAQTEEAFTQLAVLWAQSQMRKVGTGTEFAGRVFACDVPISVQIDAYKKFIGIENYTQLPKPRAEQQVVTAQELAAARAAARLGVSSSTPPAPVPSTPRIDCTQRPEIAQELGRVLDCTAGEAMLKTSSALQRISQSVSAESVRKNVSKFPTVLVNAVGVYLGVLDAHALVEPNLVPAEVATHKALCVLIYDAAKAWLAERAAITVYNETGGTQ